MKRAPKGYRVKYQTMLSGHGKAWHVWHNGVSIHPPLQTREDAIDIAKADQAAERRELFPNLPNRSAAP